MDITNLTGTTWTFNPQVDKLSVGTIFKINGVATSGDLSLNVHSIQFDVNSMGNVYFARLSTKSVLSAAGSVFQHSTYWSHYPNATSGLADPVTLAITDGDDVTNADLIAWLEANATLAEHGTLIAYNGATAEMKNGQTATIKCAGKKAVTDIVIVPEFSVEIAYGDIINEAHKGQTATLKCAGKKMKHDVIISTIAVETDELAGTWQFNNIVPLVDYTDGYWTINATMSADGYSITTPCVLNGYNYYELKVWYQAFKTMPRVMFPTYNGGSNYNGWKGFVYYGDDYTGSDVSTAGWYYYDGAQYIPCSAPTIKISTKYAEVEKADKLLAYLQANATKQ